jgi:hypothetical protein
MKSSTTSHLVEVISSLLPERVALMHVSGRIGGFGSSAAHLMLLNMSGIK